MTPDEPSPPTPSGPASPGAPAPSVPTPLVPRLLEAPEPPGAPGAPRLPGTPGRHRDRQQFAILGAVGAGGALGGVARYQLGLVAPAGPGGFPWTTFAVNVTGALVVGALVTLIVERWPPTRYVRPFAAVGACGGYTTWSTFMTDAALLARDGRPGTAAGYGLATLACGLAATAAGITLARLWPARSGEAVVPLPGPSTAVGDTEP